MKPPDNPSKFMSEVLECIASLRDVRGSPPHKIIDYIILSKKAPARNAELLVKKTLKSGVRAGLLKELDGKFKLAMDRKDFRVMRGFCGRKQGDGPMPIAEGRRRGRRGRRKGRSKGRRRRRRRSPGKRRRALDESGSEEYCNEHIGEPEDRARRRRRRRRSRRRGGKRRSPRRRRRNASLENSDGGDSREADNSESPEPRGQNNDEEEPSDRGRRRRRRRRSRRRGRSKKRSPRRRRRNAEHEEGNGGDDSGESGNGQPAEDAAKERPRRSRSHNRGEEDMGGPGDVPSERRQTPCIYDEDVLNEPDFDHSQYDSKSFS